MQPTSTYDTQALARRLNSADEQERQNAQAELRALLAADVRWGKLARYAQNVISVIYVLFYFHAMFSGKTPISDFVFPALIAYVCAQYLISQPAKEAARRIAALDIPQAVGPLIEVHITSGLFRSRHVKAALIRLLPRLRPADAGLLTPLQRKYLGWMLTRDEPLPWCGRFWGPEIKVAILRALEQTGDQKAFAQVQKMARSAHDWQVRVAAQQCLPFLQQRVEQISIEQTLLRASTQSHAPDILLRPASSTESADPQILLRASVANDAD